MCLTLQLGEFGSVPSKILKILRFDSFVHCLANPKEAGAKKWDRDEVRDSIKNIPLHRRRTIRALAAALGIPTSTLFMVMKQEG